MGAVVEVEGEAGAASTVVAVVVMQQMRGRRLSRRAAGVEDIWRLDRPVRKKKATNCALLPLVFSA